MADPVVTNIGNRQPTAAELAAIIADAQKNGLTAITVNLNSTRRDGSTQRQRLAQTMPMNAELRKAVEDDKAAQAIDQKARDSLAAFKLANPAPAAKAKLGTNVLNNYRSFNYNFTLAAITPEQFNAFQGYTLESANDLKHIVLSSKGKPAPAENNVIPESASKVLNTPTSADITQLEKAKVEFLNRLADPKISNDTRETFKAALNQNTIDLAKARYKITQASEKETGVPYEPVTTKQVIADYNKNSSGRFDMFIDDVELKTLISNNKQTTTTIGYEFNFTVIEPYSSFGFFEALQASAISAGYYSYLDCHYVLAVDFIGYKDDDKLSDPITIVDPTLGNKPALRFFPISIYDVQTTITEQGTKYICKSVPGAYGAITEEENAKTSTAPKGVTVKDQLTDLMNMMNASSKASAELINNPYWDEYKVEFPTIAENGAVSETTDNEIAGYTFDSTFDTAGMKPQEIDSLKPADPRRLFVSSFEASTPTKSKIEAIIFKSKYITDLITASYEKGAGIEKQVNAAKQANLFRVVLKKIVNKEKTNSVTGRLKATWIYQIIPSKTSFHRVPGQETNITTIDNLKDLVLRSYNYIYTGLNTDVLDFKINLNFAYYSVIGPTLGADNQPFSRQNAANNANNRPKLPDGKVPPVVGLREIPFAPWRSPPSTVEETADGVISAVAPTPGDPNLALVNILYQNLMDTPSALVDGELTILGDPYFLITGGSSNYILSNNVQGEYAGNGEAAALAGDVYVRLDFYNPTDIGANGVIDKELTGFSGIFQITGVNSIFRNGVFTQVLHYIRIPTPIDQRTKSTRNVGLSSTVAAINAIATDSAPASAPPIASADKIVTTRAATENKPPVPPSNSGVVSPGFTEKGNPVSLTSIAAYNQSIQSSLQSLKTGFTNPFGEIQSQISAAKADLQAIGPNLLASVQGVENQFKGAALDVQNKVTGQIASAVSPLTKLRLG